MFCQDATWRPHGYHVRPLLTLFPCFVGDCRLLCVEAIRLKRDKADVRTRESTRTVYSGFFFEWLPRHMDSGAELDKEVQLDRLSSLRQQYVQEATELFAARREYEVKHATLCKALNNAIASNLLKPIIAQHSGMADKKTTEILRAFRRHVAVGSDRRPCVLQEPHSDEKSELYHLLDDDSVSLRAADAVSEWVKENWEILRALERQRVKGGAVGESFLTSAE